MNVGRSSNIIPLEGFLPLIHTLTGTYLLFPSTQISPLPFDIQHSTLCSDHTIISTRTHPPHEYTNKNPCLSLPIPSFKDRTCENIDFAPATSTVSIEGIPNFQPIPVRVSYRHVEKIPSRKHNPLNCINIKPVETFINCNFKDSNDQQNVYVPSKSKLKVIHLNARTLKNRVNLHQIREFTQEHKPDIIAISESWLNSTVTNAEIEIEGFKVIRLGRLHKIGGDVCAYVRCNIKCFKIKHLSTISEDNFHQLWLRIYKNV